MLKKTDDLQTIYANSKESVRRLGFDSQMAENSYKHYVNFIKKQIDLTDKHILDVGCGNGWSSYLLAQHSQSVTGMDLHHSNFEPPQTDQLHYQQGSALELPFPNQSFDLVATHECLEHVPDPQKALSEFDRVLKPGGTICILGPNLFSVLQSIRGLFFYVWQQRPLRRIFIRDSQMPSHPHGNTLPEIFYNLFKNIFCALKIYFSHKPLFKMREPDTTPPFHADNDACYYLNPLDLKFYFESKNYQILAMTKLGQHQSLCMIPSGTWFIARKPF